MYIVVVGAVIGGVHCYLLCCWLFWLVVGVTIVLSFLVDCHLCMQVVMPLVSNSSAIVVGGLLPQFGGDYDWWWWSRRD